MIKSENKYICISRNFDMVSRCAVLNSLQRAIKVLHYPICIPTDQEEEANSFHIIIAFVAAYKGELNELIETVIKFL